MITGGVQGLGKGLAMEFARRHEIGAVNFIILDIAENLAAEMIADMEQALGSKGKQKGKYVHFYKCNVASEEDVESVWKKITQDHGPVHILVNNAARATGKSIE